MVVDLVDVDPADVDPADVDDLVVEGGSTFWDFFFGRSFAFSAPLRSRRDEGVTSMNSSSLINSMASSRLRMRGGLRRTLSSLPAARWLVSFFSLQTLTSMSFPLEF